MRRGRVGTSLLEGSGTYEEAADDKYVCVGSSKFTELS